MSTIEKALAKQKNKAKQDMTQDIVNSSQEPAVQIEAQQAAEPVIQASHEALVAQPENPAKTPEAAPEITEGRKAKTLRFPLDELDKQGYVSVNSKRKLVNEELRAIKRKLLTNAFGNLSKTLEGGNLITVTSTRPSEGKSFTAINLALSIALEQDKTVLLVDADVLKPSLSKKLQVEADVEVGLMEYLLDEVNEVSDVIYSTNVPNLKFIPAGRPSHLSTELLASQKMADLAHEFITRYPDRVVIMDSPPLLGINETVVVANLSGQVVVVVEEEKTKISELKNAVANLDKDKAIGFVMNKSKHKGSDSGYGYGYAYAYAGHSK